MALRATTTATVPGGTISTTDQTSVTYNGVTWNFGASVPVGYFVDGSPFVLSTSAFTITSTSPAASDIQSDTHIGNGMMKNPAITAPLSGTQGFDGYLGNYPTKTTYETAYSASDNIDPAIGGTINVAQGEKASFVKSVRHASKTSPTSQFQTVAKYVVLTVLDTAPPVNTVRPGVAGTAKTLRQRPTYAGRGWTIPASFPSVATILASVPDNLAVFSASGERNRFFRTDNDLGTTNDGYSGEIVEAYAQYLYALHTTALSTSERNTVLDRVMIHTNDVESLMDAGVNLNSGAGQGGGIWLWAMAAAILTDDSALHSTIRSAPLQIDDSPKWITSSDVGIAAPGQSSVSAQTYFSEMVGRPWVEPDEVTSDHAGRYVHIAGHICSWELVSILGFNQGVGAATNGYETILNGGAFNTSNSFAAGLAYCSLYDAHNPNHANSYPVSTAWRDAWAQANVDFTPWSGAPAQPPIGLGILDSDYFTAGSGQITLNDPSGFNYATETVTSRDFRYSLDGYQWVVNSGVTLPHTETGLMSGATYWCGWRQNSASGSGTWSANFPYALPITSGSDRGKVTTTGTPSAAAPTNSTAPAIVYRPYPAWGYKLWEPAPTPLTGEQVTIAAGVGDWSGYPAPTYTYQWQESVDGSSGWTDITTANGYSQDATAKEFTRKAENASQYLRCQVTATNASGSTTATSNVVQAPAISAPAANELINTNFRGAWAVDYESEIASIVTQDANAVHEPSQTFSGAAGVNFGALRCDKTAARPHLEFEVAITAKAGKSYTVAAQLVAAEPAGSAWNGNFEFDVRKVSDSTSVLSAGQSVTTTPSNNQVIDLSLPTITFGSDTAIKVRLRNTTGSGGTSLGDPCITSLAITEN